MIVSKSESSLWKHLCILCLFYIVMTTLSIILVYGAGYLILADKTTGGILDFIREFIERDAVNSFSQPNGMPDDDLSGVFYGGAAFTMFGTAIICSLAMLLITMLNVVYVSTLSLVKTDHLLRQILRYNQKIIFDDPLKYYSHVIAVVVFILFVVVEVALSALSLA